MLCVVVVSFLGVLIYLGTQGEHFAKRNLEHARAQRTQLDEYVRETARWQRSRRTAAGIARAKGLLDSGAIDQAEFDRLNQKALG